MKPEPERLDGRTRQTGFGTGRRHQTEESLRTGECDEPSNRVTAVYAIIGLLVLLYIASSVAYASIYEPNLQFFAYYAIDYRHGFVRRGLIGEIIDLFPASLYFTGLLIMRWLVPTLFGVAIAAVAWTVASTFGRSERRLMLALLIPALPFGLVRAVAAPTPDLLGEAALALFAVMLASPKGSRSLLPASGIYGMTVAVLTLIHEAVPFLQALGAILAIAVLPRTSVKIQRVSALLAVAPGLAVALAIAGLRQRDVSSQCARLPHRTLLFAPGRYVDYHDWTCRYITVTTRKTPLIELNPLGWGPWIMQTIAGLVVFAVTVFVVRGFSGVPLGRIRQAVQRRHSWIALAALLLLPIFATAADWLRWWIVISFDVGVVYLLYASREPESARPAARRTRISFAVAIVAFTALPILTAISTEQGNQRLMTHCSQLAADPMWVSACP
ncbi:hypothetical protein [Mycobacterium sp. Marseille-P9652]|uniref:hypothetical protein n=1 Tax=Mycobacterium sp. Marseille-P9652 TaxID=2654950 RepID=UPI0012E939BD|nr:hypothetical protein [Mycobacterium sp. Marseille-P9652]